MGARQEPALRVALCDDNAAFMDLVATTVAPCLRDIPHTVEMFSDPKDLLEEDDGDPFELLLLDIQMPGLDGISLAERVLRQNPHCYIIFLSAYLGYAQDVYDVEHKAFILKSELEERLPHAIERYLRQYTGKTQETVGVMDNGKMRVIPQREIMWLEHRVRATYLVTASGKIPSREKLEDVLARLNPNSFCQIHKSFAVNWRYVLHYEKQKLTLSDGTEIGVSRNYTKTTKEAFMRYLSMK